MLSNCFSFSIFTSSFEALLTAGLVTQRGQKVLGPLGVDLQAAVVLWESRDSAWRALSNAWLYCTLCEEACSASELVVRASCQRRLSELVAWRSS